jgi:hypothetical protein
VAIVIADSLNVIRGNIKRKIPYNLNTYKTSPHPMIKPPVRRVALQQKFLTSILR